MSLIGSHNPYKSSDTSCAHDGYGMHSSPIAGIHNSCIQLEMGSAATASLDAQECKPDLQFWGAILRGKQRRAQNRAVGNDRERASPNRGAIGGSRRCLVAWVGVDRVEDGNDKYLRIGVEEGVKTTAAVRERRRALGARGEEVR